MDTPPPEPPRGVQIYDRPAGADRPRWIVPAVVAAVLTALVLLYLLMGGLG